MEYQILFLSLLFVIFFRDASCAESISIGTLVSRIESMELKYELQTIQMTEENQKIRGQLEILEDTVIEQNKLIEQLHSEINDNEKAKPAYNHALKRNSRFVLDDSETVAFHATITGRAAIQHLHVNQTVIFDHVMLNIGGAYHSHQGLFVTNTAGIYLFSVSIMAVYGATDSTMIFIMKNGKEVAAAIADGRGGQHDQGSTTVVLQLALGDEVWVSVKRHEDTSIWTDSLDSFMGCLITYT